MTGDKATARIHQRLIDSLYTEAMLLADEARAYFDEMGRNERDTLDPMTRVVPIELKKRTDVISDGDIADDVTKNAPLVEDHYYVVPKVVE